MVELVELREGPFPQQALNLAPPALLPVRAISHSQEQAGVPLFGQQAQRDLSVVFRVQAEIVFMAMEHLLLHPVVLKLLATAQLPLRGLAVVDHFLRIAPVVLHKQVAMEAQVLLSSMNIVKEN